MNGMFLAETAVLVHFKAIRVILFVFHRVVVPLLTFGTGQRNSHAHGYSLLTRSRPARPTGSVLGAKNKALLIGEA
jgi:hypothetical protein